MNAAPGTSRPGLSSLTLQDILAVEDTEELLAFTCPATGMPLWPVIRQAFLRFIMSDAVYGEPFMSIASRPRSGAVRATVRAAAHNAARAGRLQGHGRVVLMATGLGHLERDGKWFNRLSDYFAMAADETVVVEDLFEWRWPHPRYNERLLYHTPIQLESFVAARVLQRARHRAVARRLVSFMRERGAQVLNWQLGDDRAAYLERTISRHIAQAPITRHAYQRLFRRLGTLLLLKEEACYGHSALVNVVAREMGITIAEYQHGAVSLGHDAYNLAPCLRASHEYMRTLPDVFLSYGAWWQEQMNIPERRLPIGNPHRATRVEGLAHATREKVDVLVLGDGIETRATIQLAQSLRRLLAASGRWRVVFRPHPFERARVQSMTDGVHGLTVDGNSDIYDSLVQAHAVVGEVSTGLFEALGLADRVFVWQTPKSRFSFPSHPFAVCDGAEDLAESIITDQAGRMQSQDIDRIWEPNWRANYLAFLSSAAAGPK